MEAIFSVSGCELCVPGGIEAADAAGWRLRGPWLDTWEREFLEKSRRDPVAPGLRLGLGAYVSSRGVLRVCVCLSRNRMRVLACACHEPVPLTRLRGPHLRSVYLTDAWCPRCVHKPQRARSPGCSASSSSNNLRY